MVIGRALKPLLACVLLLLACWSLGADAGPAYLPLQSPYPGAKVVSETHSNYVDSISLVLSKPVADAEGQSLVVSKLERLQGQLDAVSYEHKPDDSPVELYASYHKALLKQGFNIDFDCPPGCVDESGQANWFHLIEQIAPPLYDLTLPITQIAYIAASKAKVHLIIMTGGHPSDPPSSLVAAITSKALATSALEFNQDDVSANDIASRVQQDGRIALYGVYFDTNQAQIKPQSLPLLQQVQAYLQQNPAVRLYVVGHTDDVGNMQDNLKLSEQRAAAVVADLIQRGGVSASRLTARGVGPLAPLASNHNEAGRRQNRRVELIEKLEQGR